MSDAPQTPPPDASDADPDFEALLGQFLSSSPHDTLDRALEGDDPDEVPDGHQSGFAAVVGQPNVGKSTLINAMLGEKITIVSPKPQTTRIRQLGIYSRDDVQLIFVDTPGIHRPQDELGHFMVGVAQAALQDADVVVFVVDGGAFPNEQDRLIIERLKDAAVEDKTILVLNKMDTASHPDKFQKTFHIYEELLPNTPIMSTVAIKNDGLAALRDAIIERLPLGPRYYPQDQLSDIPLRGMAAEMIREQVLRQTHQEVPHSIAVEVDEFKRRSEGLVYIHATIYAEREGQKGIIVGKHGQMVKALASAARQELQAFLLAKVYLDVRVKVLPNWRRDEAALQRFGYRL